jgi:glycosyltransferase involved in cell wall biosynthesis
VALRSETHLAMLDRDRPELSVVIPVYRSADCLPELAERIARACQSMSKTYELILVDDASPDDTARVIEQLGAKDPAIVGLFLRKNFGQDNAIMAGLNTARGDAVVIMDDDLQHDPADMPALVAKLAEGHDVVYAKYAKTHQAYWKNVGSWFNGRVAEIVLDKPPDIYLSPYKIITLDVATEIIRYRGPYPYVDGLLFRTTSRMAQINVQHHPRFKGKGSYTLWRSISVWLRLCTNFSVVPLRIATFTGCLSAGLGLALALAFLIYRLCNPTVGHAAEGWASIILSVLVLGGIQLLTIGMLGEYVGQMHLNINSRPQYVVRSRFPARPARLSEPAPTSVASNTR